MACYRERRTITIRWGAIKRQTILEYSLQLVVAQAGYCASTVLLRKKGVWESSWGEQPVLPVRRSTVLVRFDTPNFRYNKQNRKGYRIGVRIKNYLSTVIPFVSIRRYAVNDRKLFDRNVLSQFQTHPVLSCYPLPSSSSVRSHSRNCETNKVRTQQSYDSY